MTHPHGRARRLLGPEGPLARAFPEYEERSGQLDMADAVEEALADERTLLVEAGTGTGKTLAYLVPALLSGKKVVVSTATKALQEQIFTKDLPLVFEHLGIRADVALGKGLGNYLCLRRFNELRGGVAATGDLEHSRTLGLLERWAEDTETGDVAELTTLPEGTPIWREVCSSSETRIGQGCEYFDRCFVTKMKRDLEGARVIVVNHALFFADLSVKMTAAARGFGGAGALPPYDAVIFDEAHELEAVATDFFGVRVSGARIESMLRDADRALLAAGLVDPKQKRGGGGEGSALTAVVREAADHFFAQLALVAQDGRARPDGPDSRITLSREAWSGALLDAYHRLDGVLEALCGWAETNGRDEAVRLVGQRASQLRGDAARIVEGSKNQVTWVEVRSRSVAVGASPIHLGGLFRTHVVERVGSVVLTSATLTAGTSQGEASFGFLRSRLGLDGEGAVPVDELVVPSPFDYKASALLYTPRDLPEANDPSFTLLAAQRIAELVAVTGGGAFVLCTSVRSMQALSRALFGKTPRPVLVQGTQPKLMLLRRFRADRDNVLVATMSFWEGVDVPGDALRLVIIDKIPFAVPTDPVVEARSRALEEHGKNPFISLSVPEAAITLKQGFGRLIRSRSDRGIVAILDRRLRTKGYGATLLAALPPARRTDRMSDVVDFWASQKPAAR